MVERLGRYHSEHSISNCILCDYHLAVCFSSSPVKSLTLNTSQGSTCPPNKREPAERVTVDGDLTMTHAYVEELSAGRIKSSDGELID